MTQPLTIHTAGPLGPGHLVGDVNVPENATAAVVFAHGAGSSRHSPRNRAVAEAFHQAGLATILLDLLTAEEGQVDATTSEFRFNIALLADRLTTAIDTLAAHPVTMKLPLGGFGASTGAAAVLVAAARRPDRLNAVVSRGGRPDLAGDALPLVKAPTLLIVGGNDRQVIQLNQQAASHMNAPREITVVPGAGHLFAESGALEHVADLATEWFHTHLA